MAGILELLNLGTRQASAKVIEIANGEDRIAHSPHEQDRSLTKEVHSLCDQIESRSRRVILFQWDVRHEVLDRAAGGRLPIGRPKRPRRGWVNSGDGSRGADEE